jgi:hypothetical protein
MCLKAADIVCIETGNFQKIIIFMPDVWEPLLFSVHKLVHLQRNSLLLDALHLLILSAETLDKFIKQSFFPLKNVLQWYFVIY